MLVLVLKPPKNPNFELLAIICTSYTPEPQTKNVAITVEAGALTRDENMFSRNMERGQLMLFISNGNAQVLSRSRA